MDVPVTVLASGGLDSTACIAYYVERGAKPTALWIDYGQVARAGEETAIEHVTEWYSIPLQKIRLTGITWPALSRDVFEFRGRNLTLVALALNATAVEGGLIALGIHSGTPFPDCTEGFAHTLDQLVSSLSSGCVRLDCPFLHWNKHDVLRYSANNQVPLHLSYSCERGTIPECGECGKCRDNIQARKHINNS